MIAATADPEKAVACTAQTILPQLTVCNAIVEYGRVAPLPEDRMQRVTEPEPGVFMPGLADEAWQCFEQAKLPSELGFDWAQQPSDIPLKGYIAFGRPYCEKEEQK